MSFKGWAVSLQLPQAPITVPFQQQKKLGGGSQRVTSDSHGTYGGLFTLLLSPIDTLDAAHMNSQDGGDPMH